MYNDEIFISRALKKLLINQTYAPFAANIIINTLMPAFDTAVAAT